MSGVLWQGDKRWGKTKLGEGGSTIGKAGCLLTCLAQASRAFAIDAAATPATIQEKALAAGGRPFRGPNAITEDVAVANGILVSHRVNEAEGQQLLRETIAKALVSGELVLLHVDHDSERGGDPDADHWVLGTAIVHGDKADDDVVVYADPATADEGSLSMRTLSGLTSWAGKPRTYRVRAVRVLKKAEAH
jgi:hypothetical protein